MSTALLTIAVALIAATGVLAVTLAVAALVSLTSVDA
jgi:hypothetical protein